MDMLSLEGTRGHSRRRAAAISAATLSLARSERRGERPESVGGEALQAWQLFKGRLTTADYIELLIENAAASQPFAYDLPGLLDDEHLYSELPPVLASEWTEQLPALDLARDAEEFITDVARLLKLPTRFNRTSLHKVLPHHRVLELPGTGGQLALHAVRRDEGVYLADSFTIACGTRQERLLAGLVAVECGVVAAAPIVLDPTLDTSRELHARYDHVIGLHPDNGGLFPANQLAIWFPSATVKLI